MLIPLLPAEKACLKEMTFPGQTTINKESFHACTIYTVKRDHPLAAIIDKIEKGGYFTRMLERNKADVTTLHYQLTDEAIDYIWTTFINPPP